MIRQFLDLSTSHLTQETCDYLFTGEIEVLAFPDNAEGTGCFVYVPSDPDFMEVVPADLMAAIRLARQQGCDYILFDRDGTTVEQLPTYDW